MTRTLYFAIPGDIATPTGGYAYARRLIRELAAAGWRVERVGLPAAFPFPDSAALADTRAQLITLPEGSVVLVDGLAFGAMPEIACELSQRCDLIALVHHPLADETGLPPEALAALERSERAALAQTRAVICTSETTARRLAEDFGVDPRRICVAQPGTDSRPRARGSAGNPPVIASIGSLVHRKGHDVLIKALAQLMHLPWTARIAGAEDRDPACATALKALTKDLGLDQRVSFLGAISDPDAELACADVFALATRHEGYGMVFAEALAHGLPVVGCRVGAVPEVVRDDAGTLVPPDDPDAFAAALAPLLSDPPFRRSRADAAWAAGQALLGWRDTATVVARCLASR